MATKSWFCDAKRVFAALAGLFYIETGGSPGQARQSVQAPMRMKPNPATRVSNRVSTCWATKLPASTPMAHASTRPDAAASEHQQL